MGLKNYTSYHYPDGLSSSYGKQSSPGISILGLYFKSIKMKNKLILRTYKCKCGDEIKFYVWDSDINWYEFPCVCGATIGFKNIKVDKIGTVTAIRTPTKNR